MRRLTCPSRPPHRYPGRQSLSLLLSHPTSQFALGARHSRCISPCSPLSFSLCHSPPLYLVLSLSISPSLVGGQPPAHVQSHAARPFRARTARSLLPPPALPSRPISLSLSPPPSLIIAWSRSPPAWLGFSVHRSLSLAVFRSCTAHVPSFLSVTLALRLVRLASRFSFRRPRLLARLSPLARPVTALSSSLHTPSSPSRLVLTRETESAALRFGLVAIAKRPPHGHYRSRKTPASPTQYPLLFRFLCFSRSFLFTRFHLLGSSLFLCGFRSFPSPCHHTYSFCGSVSNSYSPFLSFPLSPMPCARTIAGRPRPCSPTPYARVCPASSHGSRQRLRSHPLMHRRTHFLPLSSSSARLTPQPGFCRPRHVQHAEAIAAVSAVVLARTPRASLRCPFTVCSCLGFFCASSVLAVPLLRAQRPALCFSRSPLALALFLPLLLPCLRTHAIHSCISLSHHTISPHCVHPWQVGLTSFSLSLLHYILPPCLTISLSPLLAPFPSRLPFLPSLLFRVFLSLFKRTLAFRCLLYYSTDPCVLSHTLVRSLARSRPLALMQLTYPPIYASRRLRNTRPLESPYSSTFHSE